MSPNNNKQASLGKLQSILNTNLLLVSGSFLFLNEEKSDIIFKVQDQTIPAHKQILIERSKYFKNLFNSTLILI